MSDITDAIKTGPDDRVTYVIKTGPDDRICSVPASRRFVNYPEDTISFDDLIDADITAFDYSSNKISFSKDGEDYECYFGELDTSIYLSKNELFKKPIIHEIYKSNITADRQYEYPDNSEIPFLDLVGSKIVRIWSSYATEDDKEYNSPVQVKLSSDKDGRFIWHNIISHDEGLITMYKETRPDMSYMDPI